MNCNHNQQCKFHKQMELNVNGLQSLLDSHIHTMRNDPYLEEKMGTHYQDVLQNYMRFKSMLMNGIANWNKGK